MKTKFDSSYHHGNLEGALIEAALTILREQGAAALSLRSIANKAGVSHAAPYSHFSNKQQLLGAVATHGFEILADAMDEVLARTKDIEKAMTDMGVAYVEFAMDNPSLFRLMVSQSNFNDNSLDASSSDEINDLSESSAFRAYELLHNCCIELCKDKKSAKIRATHAWGLVHGLSSLIIDRLISIDSGKNRSRSIRQLIRAHHLNAFTNEE